MHWMKNREGKDANTAVYRYKNTNKTINSGRITTFSEYSVVSSNRVTKILKNEDHKIASLMGCCLTTGIGTVMNQSKVKINEKVLIVGAGGVGLSILVGLKIINNQHITIADINNTNLKKAKQLSKIKTINPNDKKLRVENYNHIFITTGEKKALEFGINYSHPPCNIYLVGVPSPKTSIKLSALDIHRKKTFFGSTGGEIEPHRDISKYLNFYKKNKKLFKKVILSTSKLKDVPMILKKMTNGKINHGRNLIKF